MLTLGQIRIDKECATQYENAGSGSAFGRKSCKPNKPSKVNRVNSNSAVWERGFEILVVVLLAGKCVCPSDSIHLSILFIPFHPTRHDDQTTTRVCMCASVSTQYANPQNSIPFQLHQLPNTNTSTNKATRAHLPTLYHPRTQSLRISSNRIESQS